MFAFQDHWDQGWKAAAAPRNMAYQTRFGGTSDPSKFASVSLPEADEYGEHPVLHIKQPPAFCEGKSH